MSLSRFLVILVALGTTALAYAQTTPDAVRGVYREILGQVKAERLRRDYERIAAFGSRMAGSPAEAKTFDLVQGELTNLGARNPRRHKYNITVPDPSAAATLTLGGKAIKLFPLWPNLVRTSTCDVAGPLLYGGDGSLESLRGLEVRDTIVVLEMGVGATWKNAAKLGAKAAIFVQPDDLPRANAETKYSGIPLDFPRFYLPLRDAGPVLAAAEHKERASLSCRQDWVVRTGQNLLMDLPGTDPAGTKEPIELVAYADAMSVIPGIAPGAEAISGPAVLMEAARIWSARPHRRPLRLTLLSGHGFALQGIRQHVESMLTGKEPAPYFSLTLDISSGSRAVGSYARAWFYDYHNEPVDPVRQISRTLRAHADLLAQIQNVAPSRMVLTDAANDGDGRTWKNNVPGKFSLECEPLLGAGFNALTFFTVEDSREHVDTPFDTLDRVNMANVRRQTVTVVAMLHHLLNDTSDDSSTSDYRIPLDRPHPSTMSLVGGFGTIAGQVVKYDPTKSFVPDTPVPDTLVVDLPRQKTTMGVRNEMIEKVGTDAKFSIIGHLPVTGYWDGDGISHIVRMQAYHLDPPTGQIDYAASWGTYGDDTYPIFFPLKTSYHESPLVVFKGVPVDLYDMVDPQSMQALTFAYIIDAETGSHPQDYGQYEEDFDNRLNPEVEDSHSIFLKPGVKYQLLAGGGPTDLRMILTNSRPGDDKGTGYETPPTGSRFYHLPLSVAKDIAGINATRIARFQKYRILSQGVLDLHKHAEDEIAAAEAALKEKDWPEADRHARAAWGYALRAHPVIQSTSNDVVNGVIFYLFLLIPFSYFMERLLVGHQLLMKQLGWSVGIFVGAFFLLRLIHPAFEIVSNPAMIFIGFVMGTLSLVVVSFILGKFETSLKAIRQAQSGVHEVDIKRSSVAMAAFNLGVSNMRRRKARTVLTTLTLVVMTFIVLSFMSIVSELQLNELPSNTQARYSGMLLRNPGLEPMQLATYRQLQNEFTGRGTVVRRAAYYGADLGETGVLTLQRAERVAEVRCLLGLDPDESKVLRPQDALLPGGRWFRPGESDVVILPAPLADQLKVEPNEVGKAKVSFAGVAYTVIGIADPGLLRSMIDLDGDGMMPADFSLSDKAQKESSSSTQAFRSYIRLDPATVFILPTETALGLGSDIRTIAVQFDRPAETRKALDGLMPRLRMNLYASVPNKTGEGLDVRQFSVLQGSKGTGMGLILIQLAIASIFVLNTMVASVYERTREIGIFSSIGLAPNHISMLFFAESLVYGVLGAVIGYFVAQASAKVIVATGSLPGLTLNFSSTSAVMSAGIVMGVVILSTIYPARKAAQIAAPARNDDVFQSEPDGDTWRLPLPFSIGEAEAGPLVHFLSEWLKAYEEYTIGDFVTSGTVFEVLSGDRLSYAVEATAWLAPYDLGISQKLRLVASPADVYGIYNLDLTLTRLAGDPENWPIVNQRFLANLRRQFLTWRTLKKEERARYDVEPPKPEAQPI
ncbi:FtsX-like permease family protein [Fimbriimonas ginsengisoli]|uniref:ABC transporter, ATP-binding protein n=1 Tax=Fimbriimonas ginsengisoli Gsoil 348 TaxID=661478 RepID=A0A068NR13_FIMGI|nr:FtsX-like permease family protein [Fimbriimonas ginsengisoli]AIE85190.1 ABC transporter, ATP-binding protein [Fimbriimonas ginsengisoli Gsoil 348]